jgi:hypothetical protein
VIKKGRRLVGLMAGMEKMRSAYSSLIRKAQGIRPHDRTKHRWNDNIKLDLRQIE